ncbi:uncharacterized protein TNCV_3289881 [Trichonephila clavipes]|nr:uncharacterized protein TNCV_3289881 [Trichonephila clavipes]
MLLLSCPSRRVGMNAARACETGWTPLRWRHHLSPPPLFRHGTGGKGNILQSPAPVVSAATAHKTFGPSHSTSTYSVCTRRVFDGIEPRPSGLESDALTTRLSTADTRNKAILLSQITLQTRWFECMGWNQLWRMY